MKTSVVPAIKVDPISTPNLLLGMKVTGKVITLNTRSVQLELKLNEIPGWSAFVARNERQWEPAEGDVIEAWVTSIEKNKKTLMLSLSDFGMSVPDGRTISKYRALIAGMLELIEIDPIIEFSETTVSDLKPIGKMKSLLSRCVRRDKADWIWVYRLFDFKDYVESQKVSIWFTAYSNDLTDFCAGNMSNVVYQSRLKAHKHSCDNLGICPMLQNAIRMIDIAQSKQNEPEFESKPEINPQAGTQTPNSWTPSENYLFLEELISLKPVFDNSPILGGEPQIGVNKEAQRSHDEVSAQVGITPPISNDSHSFSLEDFLAFTPNHDIQVLPAEGETRQPLVEFPRWQLYSITGMGTNRES